MSGAPLAGRRALVTGASRGIGAATSQALASAGALVAVVGRTAGDLERVVESLGGSAAGHLVVLADLASDAGVRDTIRATSAWAGGAPDILVSNAGEFPNAPLEQLDPAAVERSWRLNLGAPFAMAHAFLPAMRVRKSGDIVTVGSIADRGAYSGNTAYSASKYGLRGLHEVLRVETQGSGVRATLVSPGPVDTAIWDPHESRLGKRFPVREAMLRAEDVASAIVFAVTQPAHVNVDELRLTRS